jgi:hypothetical protein
VRRRSTATTLAGRPARIVERATIKGLPAGYDARI